MKPDNVMGTAMNPQDWNLYSYVHGNPVNFNDPTGHLGKDQHNFMLPSDSIAGSAYSMFENGHFSTLPDGLGDATYDSWFGLAALESWGGSGSSATIVQAPKSAPKQGSASFYGHDYSLNTDPLNMFSPTQGPRAQIQGPKAASFLASAGRRIGGAYEMLAGAETLELAAALLQETIVIVGAGVLSSESGVGPIVAGIAGGATGLIGLSMVVGGGWLIYDGGVRTFGK